ncbi:MAG TPA: purine nucleoside permease [Steroidobacteraceae bacterium]|jgi:purine nucleoside permease|nr:purine nucleoside permease [Steroidobacteraceae bacterium]
MNVSIQERSRRGSRPRSVTLAMMLAVAAAAAPGPICAAAPAEPLAVKVLVINMFQAEAAPWPAALHTDREIGVPGLSSDYPQVRCNAVAVCQMTTGMGHANAAASMMAVLYSGLFDLRRTYFLIAGIAGIDPARGTIGSAAWARYAVDVGIAHEVDARELPRGWQDGFFGILTDAPGKKPRLDYRTEVFRLDEALLQRALSLSHQVTLEDSDDVRAYRAHYQRSPANQPPQVTQCDTVTSDTWWTGQRLGEHARSWTALLTDGEGIYCTTQQEDNATLNALTRGAQSGLVDLKRVALLRSGSDFDRGYAHQSAIDALRAQFALAGAGRISTDNLVRAGLPLVNDIAQHWDLWRDGVPATSAP